MIAASGSILTRRWVTTGLNLYEMMTELKVKLIVIFFFFSGVNDKLFLWKILMVEYKIANILFFHAFITVHCIVYFFKNAL